MKRKLTVEVWKTDKAMSSFAYFDRHDHFIMKHANSNHSFEGELWDVIVCVMEGDFERKQLIDIANQFVTGQYKVFHCQDIWRGFHVPTDDCPLCKAQRSLDLLSTSQK